MYQPQFNTVKPYVLNYLQKNYWKVENILSFEDAVGEAQLQFWRTVLRLNKRNCSIENDAHLMSLFKTSWTRHFITLANKNSSEIKTISMEFEDFSFLEQAVVGDLDNDGYLLALLTSAPKEIQQVFVLMLKAPAETLEVITTLINQNLVDSANTIISKWLGKPAHLQILQKTLQYLKE